jgi:hypothetical protein
MMPIDVVPDDVLLAVFDFCVNKYPAEDLYTLAGPVKKQIEVWQPLVHVCRRWRSLIFGSPRRLNLQLVCTPSTPTRDTLDVWPALPLLICNDDYREEVDNIIPALERSDRVCQIYLEISASQMERVSAAMQESFPELTGLELVSSEMETVLPDSFLSGSAPRLRHLSLQSIPFPGLPKLLSSATHLFMLDLFDIPHSGYISPEEMVTALSTLTGLGVLSLDFASPRSCPDRASRRPPPLTRTALPFLYSLIFNGASEYLADLVARIDAPRLVELEINFFDDLEIDTPQSIQFIHRTPSFETFEKARLFFRYATAGVILTSRTSGYRSLKVGTLCVESDWQVHQGKPTLIIVDNLCSLADFIDNLSLSLASLPPIIYL